MNFLKKYASAIIFPIIIIYFEVILKLSVYKTLFNEGLLNMVLFSIPVGFVLYLLSTIFGKKVNKINFILLTILITFVYGAQLIYYKIFSTFFSMYSIIGAGDAMQFISVVKIKVIQNIFPILLLLIPLISILMFNKKIIIEKSEKKTKLKTAGAALLIQAAAMFFILNSTNGVISSEYLYKEAFIINMSVERFGLFTTEMLDIKNLKENLRQEHDENVYAAEPSIFKADETKQIDKEIKYEYNVMDIDFDNLIKNEKNEQLKNMHEYFKQAEPTKKNKFTGKFKGKNLILITAESFSPYAIDKNLTPTLYKMYEEGYKFNNFYTPLWGVSTTDGEYAVCTSLIPKAGIWSFYRSAKNYMPFALGNQLKKLDYNTFAYHDHTYDYYYRNLTHPNMGYEYKGLGNGLNMTKTWPESDLEMIDITAGDFIKNQPFHTYYMTVSGHLQYTFEGNSMAYKNKDAVKNLKYSDNVKAYIACNIELDKAMESLIKQLNESGIADDTVIAISPDHYPYGLNLSEISELAGHDVEENFELYKSVFLLWSKGMESVTVDKPCSSLDILPTLSNLMGIDYDSRLLMGKDIFSDAEPLILFQNRSWITNKAMFNSETGEMKVINNSSVDEKYQENITNMVKDKFKYSELILDNDYYKKVLD